MATAAATATGNGLRAPSARRTALALLALALAVGLAARVAVVRDKPVLTHDESISFLAAGCHEGEYGRLIASGGPPLGRWVSAGAWQRFLRPAPRWCFGTIRDDLAHWDIHPPAYFWLLHAWTRASGVGTRTAAGLNLLLDLLVVLALAGLARDVTGSAVAGAGVAAVWMLSPAVVPIGSEARPYPLVALATVLVAWATLRLLELGTSPRRWLAAAAATCLGVLTHYQFVVVVLGAGLWLVPGLWRRSRAAWLTAAALAAGVAAAAALAPGFAESFRREQAQAAATVSMDLSSRLTLTARALANFLLPGALLPSALAIAIAVASGAALGLAVRRSHARDDRRALRVLALLAWIVACTSASYVSGLSHGQAMGGKYLAAAWPLAAFVPVLLLRELPAGAPRYALAAAGAVALATLALIAGFTWYPAESRAPSAAIARADGVVLHDTRRGELPRIALLLPPDMPVLAGRPLLTAAGAARARHLISVTITDGRQRVAVRVRPVA